jgi:hypothetical protein
MILARKTPMMSHGCFFYFRIINLRVRHFSFPQKKSGKKENYRTAAYQDKLSRLVRGELAEADNLLTKIPENAKKEN